jgi:hypothetical protein
MMPAPGGPWTGIAPASGGGLPEEEPMSQTKTEAAPVAAATRTDPREVGREPGQIAAEVARCSPI